MKTESGHTLLELTLVLLLSSIIFVIIFQELYVLNISINKLKIENELFLIKEHLLNIVNPKGEWAAFEKIKIIQANKFNQLFPSIQQKPKSDILSTIDFHTDFYLKPVNLDTFCLIKFSDKLIPPINQFKYMVFSKSAWSEAEINFKKVKSNLCALAYEIKTRTDYYSPFNKQNPKDNFILLPIKYSSSTYLDQNNTVRRILHSSLNNQPLEYNVDNLTLRRDNNFIIGEIQKSKQIGIFHIKIAPLISSYELYAILNEVKQ